MKPSTRLSKIIVVLICAVPMVASIAYGAVDSWTLGLLAILIALMLMLHFADALQSGELRYNSNVLQVPLLMLLAIGLVQLLPFADRGAEDALLGIPAAASLSLDPYATKFFLVRLIIYVIFFAIALVHVPVEHRTRTIAVVIVIFGTLLAFFGILQRLAMPESIYGLRPTPQAIPFGPFVNQHHFAALMEMTSGVALGLLFGSGVSRERKLFLGIAAAIMGMAVVFTGSRGGVMSYLVVLAFAGVASVGIGNVSTRRHDREERSRARRNLLILTAAGGLVVLVLGSVLFLGGEASLLRGVGLSDSQTDISSGRSHFWWIAWQIFLAHPILGAGLDAFGAAFSSYDSWNGAFRVEQAHNDYLQMLADAGMLGFGCVAAFVVILVRKGITAVGRRHGHLDRSISTGALAGCLGVLVHSFFDFPLRTPANAFFFLLLVVIAVGHGAVKQSESSISEP